ncbi:hypothetical protein QTQ03_11115 [Micromonospora sp. WMMA1363]|uniref:hypothetical protein n=1 Tax=Micromonospora sp. WMMA1363 TaxID=3053985 RepID=UPI00259D08B5|nr:hypothetical protein [Micromonospora sp. WMMA1363]MDM4720101.1 hypothetical protein [Micromonospora sp. WMMA1363]
MSRTIRKKHLLAGLAAAGVLSVGIAAPTMALAADNASPSPSASADEGTDRQQQREDRREDRQQQREDRQAKFAEALAEELGVDTDKVTAALAKLREERKADRPERPERPNAADRQAALEERLDQAVEDGKLTQEQADAITAAVEAGVFPAGGRGGHGGPGGSGGK